MSFDRHRGPHPAARVNPESLDCVALPLRGMKATVEYHMLAMTGWTILNVKSLGPLSMFYPMRAKASPTL